MSKLLIIPILTTLFILPLTNAFAESATMVYRVSLTVPNTINTASEKTSAVTITDFKKKASLPVLQTQKVVRGGQEFLLRTAVVL